MACAILQAKLPNFIIRQAFSKTNDFEGQNGFWIYFSQCDWIFFIPSPNWFINIAKLGPYYAMADMIIRAFYGNKTNHMLYTMRNMGVYGNSNKMGTSRWRNYVDPITISRVIVIPTFVFLEDSFYKLKLFGTTTFSLNFFKPCFVVQ